MNKALILVGIVSCCWEWQVNIGWWLLGGGICWGQAGTALSLLLMVALSWLIDNDINIIIDECVVSLILYMDHKRTFERSVFLRLL
ncbi:MAG: hypothetical protein GY696_35675 [Gammaproteobacteria bacterium]|nr:hypothetical protein [Gammaproteobacteria bacterium]